MLALDQTSDKIAAQKIPERLCIGVEDHEHVSRGVAAHSLSKGCRRKGGRATGWEGGVAI